MPVQRFGHPCRRLCGVAVEVELLYEIAGQERGSGRQH
jgi:hypothetical protein